MNNCVEWENQSVLSEAVKTEGAKNCPNCGALLNLRNVHIAVQCLSTSHVWTQTNHFI